MTFKRQINKLYNFSKQIDLKKENKVFIFSDCHRGAGDKADDFNHNYELFLDIINDYANRGYLLIELGDGEELWENNDFEKIFKTYRKIYEIYVKLSLKNKFYIIWGNHNRNWKNPKKVCKKISLFLNKEIDMQAYESLILKYESKKTLLLHGHQGELINDKLWWVGKFFVRKLWRPIQLRFGLPDVTSAAKNHKIRIKADKRFIKWVKNTKIPVIIGHTHRPSFPGKKQHLYFNSGSCIHPEGISGIEISDKKMKLIKWNKSTKNKQKFIEKKIIGGPVSIKNL